MALRLPPRFQEPFPAIITTAGRAFGPRTMDSRVAIVSGLAALKFSDHRVTSDLDLFLAGAIAPWQLKRELLRVNSAFRANLEAVNGVTYLSPTTRTMTPIDFIDIRVTTFEPQTRVLGKLKEGEVPWSTRDDIISMKALSASTREVLEKRSRDVNDIRMILEAHPGPLLFPGSAMAEANKAFVKGLLPTLVAYGPKGWSELEWRDRLGL